MKVSSLNFPDSIHLISSSNIAFDIVATLEESEFDFYQEACLEIISFERWRALKFVYHANAQAFIDNLNSAFATKSLIGHDNMVKISEHLNLGLINFMTAMKLVLDHTKTRLDRRFGKDSDEYKIYEAATHHEFDSHFEYRFFSKLRDFVQHCGMPLNHITETERLIDSSSNATELILELGFDSKQLLLDFKKWGSVVGQELESISNYIPVTGLVEAVTICLDRILEKSYAIEAANILKMGQKLVDLIRPALKDWNQVSAGRTVFIDNKATSSLINAPLQYLTNLGLLKLPFVNNLNFN